jgi:polysaccharide export outer membrane protein
MRRLRKALAPAVLLLALAVPALAQDAIAEYRVGPKDLLEIRVLEIPDLNVERRVSDNGAIDIPLLGDFAVGGLTAAEVRTRLETTLTSKYVNRANVSVVVKEYANQPVSVVGAVKSAGSLNISGRWSLLQAISKAGGLTGDAGRKIYVLRRAENGLSDTLEIDTENLFRSSSLMWNIPIFPADVINVPPRSQVRVFCLGEVKSPGAIDLSSEDRLTLLSVIARAGGLSDRASNTIRVKRRNAEGKDVETEFHFGRILAGKDPDPMIEPNDVIVVKESFF